MPGHIRLAVTLANVTQAPTATSTVVRTELAGSASLRTVPVTDPGPLSDRLPAGPVVSWIRDGEGFVGWGEAARLEVTGPNATARAREWWAAYCDDLRVEDSVGRTGSGPLLFGTIPFDGRTGTATYVVPRTVLARFGGHAWITSYDDAPVIPPTVRVDGPHEVRYADGSLSASEWASAVSEAVRLIRRGDVDKVVLARDLFVTTDVPIDRRFLVRELARRYPSCWTFAVDTMLGATPELLVRRSGRQVTSRVLAGTLPRSLGDAAAEDKLMDSSKDRSEHQYSVDSAADVLRRFCDPLTVPASPSLLRLPNVVHLATDLSGSLTAPTTSLDLADALNPTAAVCGTPTGAALDLIPQLERMDRGRYAGPVGWQDANGYGEWCIALRCAEVLPSGLRLFAGNGIVADSDPDRELAEVQAKFLVMRDAVEAAS